MLKGTNDEISAGTGGKLAGPIAKQVLDYLFATEALQRARRALHRSARPDAHRAPDRISSPPHRRLHVPAASPSRTHVTGNNERTVLNDRYEIQQRIGRGGMADVFLARDLLLDRPVAIKVLFPEFATDPNFVERFRREAQSAANLNHPNIVGVYDWGKYSNTYFMAMEYVQGRTLADILQRQRPRQLASRPPRSPARSRPRSASPTATASCTATSSRPTSSSAPTAR